MAKHIRVERVASLIKEELSIIFQRSFSNSEYGFITITNVIMSPDLRIAKVYISIFGDESEKRKSMSKIELEKPSIRSMLGSVLHLRFTPEIIFYLDDSLDRVMRLEKIFNQIHQEESKKEKNNNTSLKNNV